MNSLSLDAPLIAISWQNLASRVLGVPLRWNEVLLLFLATWLAYAGDRLLDSTQQAENQSELPRHRFSANYRRSIGIVWVVLFLLTTVLALTTVDSPRLLLASILVIGVAVYFLICFVSPRYARIVIPRELVVSGVFVATTLFFPVCRFDGSNEPGLLPALVMILWTLAFFNCLGISCWERDNDSGAGEITLATVFPGLCRVYPALNIFFVLLLGLLIAEGGFATLPLCLAAAAAVTALLLILIHSAKLPCKLKPVLADLSLLTLWGACLFL